MSYMTISSQENHHFSLCSYFHAHPTTLLLKILRDQCMGCPSTSNFGGTVPPVPLGLRPCCLLCINGCLVAKKRLFCRECSVVSVRLSCCECLVVCCKYSVVLLWMFGCLL